MGIKIMAKKRTWTDENLEVAKKMYMEYSPVTHIAAATNIPRTTVNYYIKEMWKVERSIQSNDLMEAISEGRREAFSELSGTALKIMSRAMKGILRSSETPSLRQALDAAKVLDTIERIAGIDDQKEREDKGQGDKLSAVDLVEKMKSDPFYKAETKEKEDEDSKQLN